MMISKALFTCPLQSQDWLKGTYSSSLLYMPWPIFEGFPSPSVSNRILAMLSNSLDRCFWTWANAQLGINLHSRFETLQCCFSGPVFCYTSASFWWKRFWWRVVFNSYLFFWGQKKPSALMMEVGVTYKTISTIAPVWALNVLQNSAAVSQKPNDTMEHSFRKLLVK